MPRLIVVSELYYPELTSTGYFITKIAERAAAEHEVHVICAQPTYAARGTLAPASEVRNGVRIERRGSTRFDKDVLPLRIVNALSISISLALGVWQRARRGDQVLVVTNPPLLPFTAWCAAKLRGARMTLLVHDLYPEVLVAAGLTSRGGILARALTAATTWLFSRIDRLIVIGRDAADLLGRRGPAVAKRLTVVTNWADTDEIVPLTRTENPREFVVLYSGNIGRTHGLESLLDAAAALRDDTRIRFVISGWGARRKAIESAVTARGLTNVTVQDLVPRGQLGAHLAAADLCVIAMVPGMYGVSVPSRTYNIMAAGKPILAIADRDSEVWKVVEEERIGWTVESTSSPQAIAAVVREAADNPEKVRAAGARAREAAVARYSESRVLGQFLDVLRATNAS